MGRREPSSCLLMGKERDFLTRPDCRLQGARTGKDMP